MKEQVAQITQRYTQEHHLRSADEFARALGVPVTGAAVRYWRSGHMTPSYALLYAVLSIPTAADWARQWAFDILTLYAEHIARQYAPTSGS